MDVANHTPPVGRVREYKIPGENWIHGIRHISIVTADTMKRLPDFPVHEDDVYICAYPKSGNTWVATIVSAILGQDNLDGWVQQPSIVPGTHIELFY